MIPDISEYCIQAIVTDTNHLMKTEMIVKNDKIFLEICFIVFTIGVKNSMSVFGHPSLICF